MNQLWANDASFNDGTGIADAVILARHLATGAVSATKLGLTVQSFVNTGIGGGTFYYINLGGIKLMWGVTGNINVSAGSNAAYQVLPPANFFTSVQHALSNAANMTAVAEMYTNIASVSTTNVNGYISNRTTSAGTAGVSVFIIGS